ncbi:amylosucrase [Kocuria soli]|uniref:Amylosucrase n=1 Tax=Kocuria soli TaxID=2485125 RepID=A0A3N3ZVW8_9MICC|nr:alpha-amylase family protein [Kocuria soli]ROZ64368.1 amylosucrase [Kocuria soli]
MHSLPAGAASGLSSTPAPDRPSDLNNTTAVVEAAKAGALQHLEALVAAGTVQEPEALDFLRRFDLHYPALIDLVRRTYGSDGHVASVMVDLGAALARSWGERSADLRALDRRRSDAPDWFLARDQLGGVCYVDRWAGNLAGLRERIPYLEELGLTYLHLMPAFAVPDGNNDGGYAVSSYRHVDPRVGTMEELAELSGDLRERGISLVVDFVLNHTANDHEWAKAARAGDPKYQNYYWIYPDRQMPDAFERTTREIFPDDHPGSFTPVAPGDPRWVWTTFHDFQWDLNWTNPEVLAAMAGEMLFLANQGAEVLRFDAVAFLWKELGTSCESLPQAHWIVQMLNRVCRIAAPATIFKSEAIVHPDEVVQYIHPDECQISYNPLQMALTWEALATRKGVLLNDAIAERHGLPPGTAWVNYVRSHDDIGWTFSDEDAARRGIDGYHHRRFLNDFYTGRFPDSFADGVAFQYNPKTGDARVCGTTASLAGTTTDHPSDGVDRVLLAHGIAMSTGGLPLLYLGDELAQTNDPDWRLDPANGNDSRWAHRPYFPETGYAQRTDSTTVPGRVFQGLKHLLTVREQVTEFDGADLIGFDPRNEHLVGYQRPGLDPEGWPSVVLCLANVDDHPHRVEALTLSGFEREAVSLLDDKILDLAQGVDLPSHSMVWLRVYTR